MKVKIETFKKNGLKIMVLLIIIVQHKDRQGAYYSCCSVFVARPTERASVAQGLFLVGPAQHNKAKVRPVMDSRELNAHGRCIHGRC